jgi:hypothetical protein
LYRGKSLLHMMGLSDEDLDQSLRGMQKVLLGDNQSFTQSSDQDKRRRLFVQLAFFIDQYAAPLKRNALDGLHSGPFFSLLSAEEHAELSPPFDPNRGPASSASPFEGSSAHRMFDPFSSHLCLLGPSELNFTKWRIAIFVWVRFRSFLLRLLLKKR